MGQGGAGSRTLSSGSFGRFGRSRRSGKVRSCHLLMVNKFLEWSFPGKIVAKEQSFHLPHLGNKCGSQRHIFAFWDLCCNHCTIHYQLQLRAMRLWLGAFGYQNSACPSSVELTKNAPSEINSAYCNWHPSFPWTNGSLLSTVAPRSQTNSLTAAVILS